MPTPELCHRRGRAAVLKRHRVADDPELADARRDLAAVQIADYVKRVVDKAPPLTDAQRNKIASLLRPTGGEAA